MIHASCALAFPQGFPWWVCSAQPVHTVGSFERPAPLILSQVGNRRPDILKEVVGVPNENPTSAEAQKFVMLGKQQRAALTQNRRWESGLEPEKKIT